MGNDEAGTLAQLKEIRQAVIDAKIAEHRGRIVKLTGDGVLAEFPSVVNAVSCATEIQTAMRARTPKRDPISRRDKPRRCHCRWRRTSTATVSSIARPQSLAQPGGIAVSQSVRDHVGNRPRRVTFEDRGEEHLKNIESRSFSMNVLWRIDFAETPSNEG